MRYFEELFYTLLFSLCVVTVVHMIVSFNDLMHWSVIP